MHIFFFRRRAGQFFRPSDRYKDVERYKKGVIRGEINFSMHPMGHQSLKDVDETIVLQRMKRSTSKTGGGPRMVSSDGGHSSDQEERKFVFRFTNPRLWYGALKSHIELFSPEESRLAASITEKELAHQQERARREQERAQRRGEMGEKAATKEDVLML